MQPHAVRAPLPLPLALPVPMLKGKSSSALTPKVAYAVVQCGPPLPPITMHPPVLLSAGTSQVVSNPDPNPIPKTYVELTLSLTLTPYRWSCNGRCSQTYAQRYSPAPAPHFNPSPNPNI